MGIMSILGGEETAESRFKRTETGWIFKTPWLRGLFGLGAFYHLDDAQKADVKRLYIIYLRSSMLGVIPVVLLLVVLQNHFPLLARGYVLPIVIAWGVLMGLAVLTWFTMQLKRRLAGLAPTAATLTIADQYKTLARETPLWRAVMFEIIALLLLAAAFVPQKEQTLSSAMRIVGGLLFGFVALYYGYAILLKLVARTRRV